MREIKFRAWDVYNKVMREVRSLHNIHSGVNVHADLCTVKNDPTSTDAVISSHYTAYNLELVFLQYTGLKDKNGKEIYEGDILLISDEVIAEYIGGSARYEPENRIEAVVWDEKHALWSTDKDILCEQYRDSEIIGTIYENPELIKK